VSKNLPCCTGNTAVAPDNACGDCPLRASKPAPSSDILDPKDIAARMKAAGRFDKDEPWPGWNAGKKLVEKEPEAHSDGIVEGYGMLCPMDDDGDYLMIQESPPCQATADAEAVRQMLMDKIIAAMGVPLEQMLKPFMYADAETRKRWAGHAGKFATGGVVYPMRDSKCRIGEAPNEQTILGRPFLVPTFQIHDEIHVVTVEPSPEQLDKIKAALNKKRDHTIIANMDFASIEARALAHYGIEMRNGKPYIPYGRGLNDQTQSETETEDASDRRSDGLDGAGD